MKKIFALKQKYSRFDRSQRFDTLFKRKLTKQAIINYSLVGIYKIRNI